MSNLLKDKMGGEKCKYNFSINILYENSKYKDQKL